MNKTFIFSLGFLILLIPEILRVYWIMPFPGSQQWDTIHIAYFIHNYIWLFRLLGLALLFYPTYHYLAKGNLVQKSFIICLFLVYGVVFYLFNFRFLADTMFYQPKNKKFANKMLNQIDKDKLVLGIRINGEAKAYPMEIIGYHHQVQDSIAGKPVIITYCTVCRTGRAFSPIVNGKHEKFRLVGMDHFNAMFEDESTKSWWRQVTGEAIVGEMKGKKLEEIPSEQMTLKAWFSAYSQSLVLQPDTLFREKYEKLAGFDSGTLKSNLIGRNKSSWQDKSWVVGIVAGDKSRAYDWNDLKKQRVINDVLGEISVVLILEPDKQSFHAWQYPIKDEKLNFVWNVKAKLLQDTQTKSVWNFQGQCIEGKLKGKKLKNIQAYQEFWHSWRTFQPKTTKYVGV